jgi:hypothetical protein
MFLLDSFDAAEWIDVQRRRRRRDARRHRRNYLPTRSEPPSGQRLHAGNKVSKFNRLGQVGSVSAEESMVDLDQSGRMGQDRINADCLKLRILQFARGVSYRLGFQPSRQPPLPVVPQNAAR